MGSSKRSFCFMPFRFLAFLLLFFSFSSALTVSVPLNCSDTSRVCTSFMAYRAAANQSLALIESMFDVLPSDVTMERIPEADGYQYLFIRKNCSCFSQEKQYLSSTTFTVRENNGSVDDMVLRAYDGLLASEPNWNRTAYIGAVVSLRLLCGCSSSLWNYIMTYVVREGDTVASLASRFGVSMADIENLNGIADRNAITVGKVYYIPLMSVPGVPYTLPHAMSPAPPPAVFTPLAYQEHHSKHFPLGWILGSVGVGLVLILAVLLCIWCKTFHCCSKAQLGSGNDNDGKICHKFHILRGSGFCYPSGRYICCKSGKPSSEIAASQQTSIAKDLMSNIFHMEKPVIFTYDEILSSTDGFSDSNLLGNGTYGSVYYGMLRDQEVAIKRMTATKTKEFMAEMKVLCKVHHANLVELIGYAATEEELFLVYEYAHKSSLANHLHDPQNKGQTSLSWISRVQIALDAARGLEYIHEHAKAQYVHRDIKSSNILLDNSLRAKISDFGLAKLVGKTAEGEASATRIVGTFGYLAPEYLSDGQATTKSDVYAFGVVLFELISGKEAITKTNGRVNISLERRSLVSIMVAALRNSPNSMSMASLKECIDPNLMDLYPHDCVYKMSMLAKQCVDEEPILRPDMKQVVIALSQILLSSIEWEATLAGNSQVFSGLVQGR
ncbi:lysM domain receptor-like kinase 3 [Nymphaea colorata]|nr:lysM domain receptor-like kinase 3 [Nymphaea colorata]XP_049934316.1 lysM domain receptor-like kinase 3 [Nymphaea colorata]